MLIMIAMGMMVEVLMYQQVCPMDWISDGGYDDIAAWNYSDPGVIVHQIKCHMKLGDCRQ